jgi:hypothetical protein
LRLTLSFFRENNVLPNMASGNHMHNFTTLIKRYVLLIANEYQHPVGFEFNPAEPFPLPPALVHLTDLTPQARGGDLTLGGHGHVFG